MTDDELGGFLAKFARTLKQGADAHATLSAEVSEHRNLIFALIAALTNQGKIDRPRLDHDFRAALRGVGVDLNEPSTTLKSFLNGDRGTEREKQRASAVQQVHARRSARCWG